MRNADIYIRMTNNSLDQNQIDIVVMAVRAKHCIAFYLLSLLGLQSLAPSYQYSRSTSSLLGNLISLITAATLPKDRNSASKSLKSNFSHSKRLKSKPRNPLRKSEDLLRMSKLARMLWWRQKRRRWRTRSRLTCWSALHPTRLPTCHHHAKPPASRQLRLLQVTKELHFSCLQWWTSLKSKLPTPLTRSKPCSTSREKGTRWFEVRLSF
jgi:hypothetical protein